MEIIHFPIDIIMEIYNYIRPKDLFQCNTFFFIKYYKHNREFIWTRSAYVRYLIRNDMQYIFDIHIKNNFNKYSKIITYIYGKVKYKSFLHFMDKYCIDNRSSRCRQIIQNRFKSVYE